MRPRSDPSDPSDRGRFEATGAVAFLLGVAAVVLGVPTAAGAAMFVPFVVLLGGLVLTRARGSRGVGSGGERAGVAVERWRRFLAAMEASVLVPLVVLEPWASRPDGRALLGLGLSASAGVVAAWQFWLAPPPAQQRDPGAGDVPGGRPRR